MLLWRRYGLGLNRPSSQSGESDLESVSVGLIGQANPVEEYYVRAGCEAGDRSASGRVDVEPVALAAAGVGVGCQVRIRSCLYHGCFVDGEVVASPPGASECVLALAEKEVGAKVSRMAGDPNMTEFRSTSTVGI